MIGCSHGAITPFFFPSWCFEVRLGKKQLEMTVKPDAHCLIVIGLGL